MQGPLTTTFSYICLASYILVHTYIDFNTYSMSCIVSVLCYTAVQLTHEKSDKKSVGIYHFIYFLIQPKGEGWGYMFLNIQYTHSHTSTQEFIFIYFLKKYMKRQGISM